MSMESSKLPQYKREESNRSRCGELRVLEGELKLLMERCGGIGENCEANTGLAKATRSSKEHTVCSRITQRAYSDVMAIGMLYIVRGNDMIVCLKWLSDHHVCILKSDEANTNDVRSLGVVRALM